MAFFKRRDKPAGQQSLLGLYLSGSGELPVGYSRLIDAPEVSDCINRIAAILSLATIYLRRNTDQGDVRITDSLSRMVDINPMPGVGTRALLIDWIVSTMLGDGDGNAFVCPRVEGGEVVALDPMPGAAAVPMGKSYVVNWDGHPYDPTEVLHFRLHSDPLTPWKGRGIRVSADRLAQSIANTNALKTNLSKPDYRPPMAIIVNADADLSDPEAREKFREQYLSDDPGKPWILPEGLTDVKTWSPMSLVDMAVKDTVELDKKSVCSLLGCPPYMLGLEAYSQSAHNNFVRTTINHIATVIEQTLTLGLLPDRPQDYFQFNRRRLYDYDLKTLIDIDNSMADRGYLNGDEVREDAFRDPAGLTEYKVLENYIPYDMSGLQNKLKGGGDNAETV